MADNVEIFKYVYDFEDKVSDGMEMAGRAVDSFVQMTTKGLNTAVAAGSGVLGVFNRMGRPLARVISGFAEWGRNTFQVGERLGGVISGLKFVAKVGGLAVLAGPLIPLIKPVMSLFSVISDTIGPALEIISARLKAAFAPLTVAFQELALKILPLLLKVAKPVVSFLVRMVESISDMFDTGQFNEILEIFNDLVGPISRIAKSFVNDFLKPVGGMLFRTVLKLFKTLVSMAVEFVKTIEPYLPQFLQGLQKIASLIISSLGEALDTLFKEIIKQIPVLVPAIMELLVSFQRMLPAIIKLLPPLLQLTTTLVTRLLVPKVMSMLVKMLDIFLRLADKALPMVEDGVDALILVLEALSDWWDREGDKIIKFWEDNFASAVEVATIAIQEIVKITGEWIKDLMEVLKFMGLIEDKSAEMEKKDDARFAASQRNVKAIQKREEDNIRRMEERLRAAGRDEEFIRQQIAFQRARAGMAVARAQQLALTKREKGGRVVAPELAIIAEREPEWVIPESEAGVMKYVPKLLHNVMGRVGEAPGAATAPAPAAGPMSQRVEQLLTEIRDLLASIEDAAEDGTLPEVLYG